MSHQKEKEHLSEKLTASSSPLAAKKSLGQHFLTNPHYLGLIADALDTAPNDTVVEIGPGKGSLTTALLAHGLQVVALEKDRRLIPYLEEKFAAEVARGELRIVETDALNFEPTRCSLKPGAWRLVGNIPYYITGALLERFLTNSPQPSTIVFLIQKEVAERIARSKKESILSLSVKAYGTPKYIKTVPAGAFSPSPKVDSAILQISNISRSNFTDSIHEELFFKLLKAGFSHKRKLVARNLESVLEPDYLDVLKKAGIPEKARAEDVPLPNWLALAYQKKA